MSEIPDVSMDLLELEDGLVVHDSADAGVHQPNIESVFPEEEGEEESPLEGRRCGLDPVLRTKSHDRD